MIIGIGTDIISAERLKGTMAPGDPFLSKTFTAEEIVQSEQRGSRAAVEYLASRFAVKEAVFKALGISGEGVRLNEIETLNDDVGRPYVRLYGKLEETARGLGVETILVSISYEPPYAVAYVALVGKQTGI